MKLKDLNDQVIELEITVSRFAGLNTSFHGRICGTVRVVTGDRETVWVGDFAFPSGTEVEVNDLAGKPNHFKLYVRENYDY